MIPWVFPPVDDGKQSHVLRYHHRDCGPGLCQLSSHPKNMDIFAKYVVQKCSLSIFFPFVEEPVVHRQKKSPNFSRIGCPSQIGSPGSKQIQKCPLYFRNLHDKWRKKCLINVCGQQTLQKCPYFLGGVLSYISKHHFQMKLSW